MTVDMNEVCLKIRNLNRTISKQSAIKHLNLEFQLGKKVALLGLNGAGKSSLIRLLVGESQVETGEIFYSNHSAEYSPSNLAFKKKLGYQADTMLAMTDMTGAEYLMLCGSFKGVKSALFEQRLIYLTEQWHIADILDKPMASLSKGNLQKLAIVQVFINDPVWLFFDEPCQSLDPIEQDRFNNNIHKLTEQQFCLFSTHNVQHALQIADQIIVFHQAQVAHHFLLENELDYLLVLSNKNDRLLEELSEFGVKLKSKFDCIFSIQISENKKVLLDELVMQYSDSIAFLLPEKDAVMPLFRLLASGELNLENDNCKQKKVD